MTTAISSSGPAYISVIPQLDIYETTPVTPDLLQQVTQSPDRSRVSVDFLEQLRQFDAPNNRLLQFLHSVENAEDILQFAQTELEGLKTLAEQAKSLSQLTPTSSLPGFNPLVELPPVAARTSVRIDESTLVDGATAGARLSISSDNGEDFIFTFSGNPTSWGEVLGELNAAQIGVTGRIDRSNPEEPRLVLESSDGKTGFRINGASS